MYSEFDVEGKGCEQCHKKSDLHKHLYSFDIKWDCIKTDKFAAYKNDCNFFVRAWMDLDWNISCLWTESLLRTEVCA